jgi:superfamily II DNA or RNA helicase
MIQTDSKYFLQETSEKYKEFKEELLPILNGNNFCKNLKEKEVDTLFQHQKFLYQYMKDMNKIPSEKLKQRGLLVYHKMGSGKTTTGILISESCRDYRLNKNVEDYKTKDLYKRKVILMIPANLLFDPWIKEISSKCFENCEIRNAVSNLLIKLKGEKDMKIRKNVIELLKTFDYHIIHYNAFNITGGWEDKLRVIPTRSSSVDKYTNKHSDRMNEFDDSVIIIDEAHNLINMFANNIESNKTDKVIMQLYEKLVNCKNSKILLLTGTPIVNRVFEIGIISNIIRGKIEDYPSAFFDENIQKFNDTFFDDEMTMLNNPKMLKRRLNGIVSYYKGIDESVFADKIEDDVLVPFSHLQESGYKKAMELEQSKMKMNMDNYDNFFDNQSLFTIKSSNVVFPEYIYDLKLQSKMNLQKNGKSIPLQNVNKNNRFLSKKDGKDNEKTILTLLNNDLNPLKLENNLNEISIKVYNIIKRAIQSNGKVVIFSRFEGLFGIKFITEALKQNGFNDYDDKKKRTSKNGSFIRWTGKKRINEHKELFNSSKNVNGEIIKIFCMTSSGKEGINLIGVRQIHILEPWWNNILNRQVIGRGIRICSHDHIPEEDFIDLRINENERVTNKRLVNVFKYYGYIDMRNQIQNVKNMSKDEMLNFKKIIRNEMKKTSIDHRIKLIAKRKEIRENFIIELLKEVAIDCDINSIRNDQPNMCFIDHQYDNYMKSWDIRDNYLPEEVDERMRMLKHNGELYFVSNEGNVYKDVESNLVIDKINQKKIKVGVFVNNKILFDNDYLNNYPKINKVIKIKNNIKLFLEQMNHNLNNKKILDITNVDNNTVLFKTMFSFLDVLIIDEDKNTDDRISKLTKYNNVNEIDVDYMNDIPNKKYDYIHIDVNVSLDESVEVFCNRLIEKSKYILVTLKNYNFNEKLVINKVYKYNNIILIDNEEPGDELKKILINNFKLSKANLLLEELYKNEIKSIDTLDKMILSNEIRMIEFGIKPKYIEKLITLRSKKEIKSKKKSISKKKGMTKKDCMGKTVKEIKKSNEYKKLPKNIGKSKLKKNKLCDEIDKL